MMLIVYICIWKHFQLFAINALNTEYDYYHKNKRKKETVIFNEINDLR